LECFLVNVLDLPTTLTLTQNPAKHIVMYRAILGKVTRSNLRYTFEARGFEYLLNNKVGSITSKLCRARFGDSRCGVNIANYTYNLSVVAAADRRTFTLSNANITVTPPGIALSLTSAPLTWAQAEAEAVAAGGHLATIRSAAENQAILDRFGGNTLWIGLRRSSPNGPFEWSSGEPVTYTNWFSGQPDNYLGIEDSVAMSWVTHPDGQWNDLPSSGQFYGVIESPNPPTIYTNAPNDWFTYGTVTFTSGNNAGVIREVASYSNNTIVLFESTPFNIAPGTTLQIATGCDKTLRNCFRYNNVVNFQGEPYIPTPDKFASTPIDAG
jgi:hypothetical protein